MTFILDTLESKLGLTPEERAIIDPALPTIATWLHLLNAYWDTLQALFHHLAKAEPVLIRLIASAKIVGPIAEHLLSGGGGMLEGLSAMEPVQDIEAVIKANSYLTTSFTRDYTKIMPLVDKISADWPKVQDAVGIIIVKMSHHNLSLSALMK